MKTRLFFSIFSFLLVQSTFSQETTVNLSLGASYTSQVYYKLNTKTETTVAANSWDLAFFRASNYEHGIRVNDGIGIEVFEAANQATAWNTIDITNEAAWSKLYNSDTDRINGAFMQGSATYGWGEYNTATHHITGTIIYVLKYTDGSYKKFICEDFYGGYTIKYASWNGSDWSEDESAVISNSNNSNNTYNYFSLQNDSEVMIEPAATDWDFVFTKYFTDVSTSKYNVTGVLSSDNITVATATGDTTNNLSYSEAINTIGYNWKSLNATWTYDVDSELKFYVKDKDEKIYKLYFTEFGGSSTGNLVFNFEDVTQTLGIEEIGESIAFGIYPNPVRSDKKINIVFDVNKVNKNENKIEIYNLSGQKVLATSITNSLGFYNKEINLSSLNSGIYMLKFTSGNYQKTKKIVIQ
jgi:hypothetical protein|tara:strand:- start:91 stop:1323 length:1233 start_codon:yes stop_codon:yes gene_type:complete